MIAQRGQLPLPKRRRGQNPTAGLIYSKALRRDLPNIFPSLSRGVLSLLFLDLFHSGDVELPSSWDSPLIGTLVDQNLEGLALRAQREHALPIPQETLNVLRLSHFNKMEHTSTVLRQSQLALEGLRNDHMEFVVTKGPGIAHLSKSPGDRVFSDLDIVVRGSDFVRALGILALDGYFERPETQPPREMFGRQCREAINLRSHNGGSIDLHHRIPPWLWSCGLRFDQLIRETTIIEYQGSEFPVADVTTNVLVTALHVFSDQGRPGRTLRTWRDLVFLLEQCDVESIALAAEESELCGWLHWIASCLPEKLRPHDLLERLEESEKEICHKTRLLLALGEPTVERPALEQLLRLPLRGWLTFGLSMLLPRRAYVEFRSGGFRHPYLRWWTKAFAGTTPKSERTTD